MRRLSREIALQVLFQSEFTLRIAQEDFLALLEDQVDTETIDYANTLISGVQENLTGIDRDISAYSRHWKIERMSLVDKNLLRIGIFEMQYLPEKLKPEIVINEVIEIAKKFGTTDSSGFVNGILDPIAQKIKAE